MSVFTYSAFELYTWLTEKEDIIVLDVRNKVDFGLFKVESPYPFTMLNISYFDFMEIEDECVVQIPRSRPIRVVCAKEGSAKYVSEILIKNGFDDVGYLEGGIKTWGNLLIPKLLSPSETYALYQFIRPGKASCSYALIAQNELMLFDPSRNTDFYLNFAKQHSCTIVKTFETHLQADYIAGSRMIIKKSGATFMANENDFKGSKLNYTPLVDKKEYSFSNGGPKIKALFTPGHTPGSTCFIVDNKYMITGDTVFIRSVGRPDLGGQVKAWSDALFDTLQNLITYADNMEILPGHYMNWDEANSDLNFIATLAETKDFNKAIYAIDNKKEFLAFIEGNMRKQPDEYATIRLINANLEQVDNDKAEELDLGKNECAATAYAAQQENAAS